MNSQQLVDRLRTDELESIEAEVASGRRDHKLKTLDERGAAQELIRQQYTGRYPFELLQNSNDAIALREAGTAAVRFVVTDTALLVADEGSGFGPEEIAAICTLGRSSKDPRKSVGYKGLGFKSVGEITESPQIISSGVRFHFDERRAMAEVSARSGGPLPVDQHLPVYALPFQLNVSDIEPDAVQVENLVDQGFSTVLRLPFKSGVTRSQVETHVEETVRPRLLLFLDSISRLEVQGTSRDFTAVVVREPADDHTELLIEIDGGQEHWLVFETSIAVRNRSLLAGLGSVWQRVQHVKVGAAIELDASGYPLVSDRRDLHVYFPTEEATGLSVLLHGDFALELDRRRVSEAPEALAYNQWLIDQLAGLVRDVVAPSLVTRFGPDPRMINAFAVVSEATGVGLQVFDKVIESLRESEFVPCIDGSIRLPGEATLLPESIPNAATFHRFVGGLSGQALVVPEVEQIGEVRQLLAAHLATAELEVDEAVSLLSSPRPDEAEDFYEFLVSWAGNNPRLGPYLEDVPCVRTIGGHWVAPASGVFFARQTSEAEFPSDIDVPIADLPNVEGLHPLLDDAGVRAFEWRQLVPEFIVPILTDSKETEPRRIAALEALRVYYSAELSGDPRIKDQIKKVLLPARSSRGGETSLEPAESVYFGFDWLGHDRLERIYGPFGNAEFLAIDPGDDEDRRSIDQGFFEWIGVAAAPRIDAAITEQRNRYKTDSLSRHPHRVYGSWWKEWLETADTLIARKCEQGHPASQQLRQSFALDRFPELVASKDSARLQILWQELAEHWGRLFEPALTASFYCQNTGHGGERSRPTASLFSLMLHSADWVPTLEGEEIRLANPQRAWWLARDTPKRIALRVPVLSPGLLDGPGALMARRLGVVDAARPSIGDLEALLGSLAGEHESSDEPNRDVHHAARWAMRTLDDVLEDDPDYRMDSVPMLAVFDGESVFSFEPVTTKDEMLRSTWSHHFPILDADKDLTRLPKAAGLRSLDEEVQVTPITHGVRPPEQEAVDRRFKSSSPYLAALAFREVPSRRDDVIRGLTRLELVVCDKLTLRYELDGLGVTREDATSHISSRTEQEGSVRRRIGTAHLELDESGQPDWFAFGAHLARFLLVPTLGDAFALLLSHNKPGREKYILSRQIGPEEFDEAMAALDSPPIDDDADWLDAFTAAEVPSSAEDDDSRFEDPEDGSAESSPDAEEGEVEEQYPDIDSADLAVLEGKTDVDPDSGRDRQRRSSPESVLGPTGEGPDERTDLIARTIGRRGEEAVYMAERARLEGQKQDPNQVRWVSDVHPYAAYDIESLDDGQRIYIEVKSTKASDAHAPFEISDAELIFSLQERGRYYIYRVTEAHTATPIITRFRDPISLLHAGSARLRISRARMSFVADQEPKD